MDTPSQSDELMHALEQNKNLAEKPNTKALTQETNEFLAEIKEFEQDRIAMAKGSERKAWKVAAGASTIAIMAVAAIVIMMPLKETQPFLYVTNPETGITEMIKPLNGQTESYGEVLDRYWINRFIVERNGYIWELAQNSFDTVKSMSTPNVFSPYRDYMTSEKSPVKVFKDRQSIEIDVDYVTFLPNTVNPTAQIPFSREVLAANGKPSTGYKKTHWVATLTYDFKAEVKTEQESRLNPLRFRVTSYREDRVVQ